MNDQTLLTVKKLLWQIENDPTLSQGDFRQKISLIQRGLDIMVEERAKVLEAVN